MGLKLKRLKGASKGHKWKKGHSCVSNPDFNKFRQRASQGFFEKIENSQLTQEAVASHETKLKGVSWGTTSVKSMAPSTVAASDAMSFCPTLLSMPRSASSAKITIGFNPPPKTEESKTVVDLQKEMEEMSVNEFDDLKSQAKTFATRFTTCSLPAFENFFNNLSVQSEHQVLMLSFHATVQEIIKDKQLPETPSSYFVAIIMSLEGFLDVPEQVSAGLALLVRVIKSVPMNVLRAKCAKFGLILNTIITKYQDSDNVQLITHVLGCLSILLRAQHLASWYMDDQLKTWLKNILVFTLHSQPRARKSGQYNVSAVLKGSQFMMTSPLNMARAKADDDDDCEELEDEDCSSFKTSRTIPAPKTTSASKTDAVAPAAPTVLEVHPAAELVADFLIGQLSSGSHTGTAAKKTLLHMLVFTRQVIMALPAHKLQVVVRRLLGLVSLGTGLVNATVMQALTVLCNSNPPPAIMPLTLTSNLLTTLTKHTAGVSNAIIAAPHDPGAVRAWSSAVTAAIQLALRQEDGSAGVTWLSEWCLLAQMYWRSDNTQVLTTMEESISQLVGGVYDLITTENCKQHEAGVRAVVKQLEAGLSYQYHGAWSSIFNLLGQCFSELGLYYASIMMPALKKLCEMMANNKVHAVAPLEKAIGKAVQGMGVEAVVYSAPVEITGDISKDEKNLWLLPLLRKFVRGSRLIFFRDHFIPLAQKCFNVIHAMESDPNANQRILSTYKTIMYQIWAMLPSFANQAQDVDESQGGDRSFAKLLCRLIEHSNESRIDCMAALRHMINADSSSTGRLAKNAGNYLPALFNVYTKEPMTKKNEDKPDVVVGSHRLAAMATIVVYMKIVPQEQCHRLMNAIVSKYQSETDKHRKKAMLNLARCFVPHVKAEYIEKLYNLIIPLIKSAKDKREHKAAYRILEDVLCSESPGAEEFINTQVLQLSELLLKSVSKAAPSSRAPRLRCATVVLRKVSDLAECESCEQFLQRAVGESVMCLGRQNSKAARRAAILLLAELPRAMQRIKQLPERDTDTAVRECMRLLSGGLLGRPTLCANTIVAITAHTYQAKDTMPVDILEQNVGNMSTLLACASREVVFACLSFLKGVVALHPPAVLGSFVRSIMAGIVSMTPDCARKYRLKTKAILTRLMRKFGDDYISKLVPAKCEILHKRIRNLRKEASRTRRQNEALEEQEEQEERVEQDDAEEGYTEKMPTTLEEILAEIDPDLVGADEEGERSSSSAAAGRKKNRPTTAWVEENDSDDEVLDLLGPEAAQAIMTKRPREKRNQAENEEKVTKKKEENGGFAVDPATGKLLIVEDVKEERQAKRENQVAIEDYEDMLHMKSTALTGKVTKRKRGADEADSDDESIDLPMPKRAREKKNFDYGSEFRSAKGRGDMMRKGQTQKPYAYVPMNKDALNRRKSAKYEGQFKAVVRGARKGARKGAQLRKTGKKQRTD